MRIVRLTAENVKRLTVVDIQPTGSLVQITGANGAGKSSVLDAIFFALGGKSAADPQPVRQGAQSATIRLDLGEIIVTRNFTVGGTTSLIVEAADGGRFSSPQRMLDEMLGALTFDPLAFSRMEPREQMDTLRKLVPLSVDIDGLDAENAADYEARTIVNRSLKNATETVNRFFASIVPSMDVTPINENALLSRLEQAVETNAGIDKAIRLRADHNSRIASARTEVAHKRELAARLIQEADQIGEQISGWNAEADAWEPLPAKVDPADLRKQIDTARAENAKKGEQAGVRRTHANAKLERDRLEAESNEITARMETRQGFKAGAIAAAKMPVPGLAFGEGRIVLNGLPFEQASSAEQLRVSVAVAMAANPKLRVLRIKDGSLLDETSLELVAQLAEAGDYQIWIERVETSGKVGIVIENGAVKQ